MLTVFTPYIHAPSSSRVKWVAGLKNFAGDDLLARLSGPERSEGQPGSICQVIIFVKFLKTQPGSGASQCQVSINATFCDILRK